MPKVRCAEPAYATQYLLHPRLTVVVHHHLNLTFLSPLPTKKKDQEIGPEETRSWQGSPQAKAVRDHSVSRNIVLVALLAS